MTFEDYKLALSRNVWPEGEPRGNVQTMHRSWLVYGLIDLQMKVPCLQTKNREEIPASATYFYCGTSVFEVPAKARVQNLKVILDLEDTQDRKQCDAVWAEAIGRQEMECIISQEARCGQQSLCGCGIYMPYGYYLDGDTWVPYPQLPYGLMYPEATTDRACRARVRQMALINGSIYLHPVINSDELIVMEWHGIKRVWADEDVIPYVAEDGSTPDPQVTEALELWLGHKKAMEPENCDEALAAQKLALYNQKVAQLIHQCREEGRLPERKDCFVDCNC